MRNTEGTLTLPRDTALRFYMALAPAGTDEGAVEATSDRGLEEAICTVVEEQTRILLKVAVRG